MTAGLLLAAGAGARLGRPKAFLELGGRSLVDRGVALLRDGGCDPVVVVLGADVRPIEGADVVVAGDWAEGMSASLRAGLRHLQAMPVEAVVVALVDQPLIGSEAVRRLLASGASAAVATYDGQPRNPVLLHRSVWDEVLAGAAPDTGARPWLRAHPDRVVLVPCDGAGDPADVDDVPGAERVGLLLDGQLDRERPQPHGLAGTAGGPHDAGA